MRPIEANLVINLEMNTSVFIPSEGNLTVTGTKPYCPVAGAIRVGSTLYYMSKDHLGSASAITDASGNAVGEDRFYPFGQTRFTTGTMLTDKLFTGQREMAGLGIYYYNARFYSPYINRFLSPDTVVPGYANPQNLNGYSYVLNNPLKYTDPTGHRACGNGEEFDCSGHKQDPNQNPHPPKPRKLPKPDESNGDGNERTKDDIVTLPIPTVTPNQGSQPHGPNWTTTAATVAIVALGATLIVGGLLLTGVGIGILFIGAAEILEVGVGAALAADAAAGIGMAAGLYLPAGAFATYLGFQAMGEAATP